MTTITIEAATIDLNFMQGSRFDESQLQFIYKTGDPSAPVDLSGWSANAQFRAKLKSPDTVFSLSTEDGSIRLNDQLGLIVLIIDDLVSSAATVYRGVYDLELIDPDGNVTRLIQGTWTMTREVTHDN